MGPLNGIRVVEIAGIGPGPMAAMLLADLGASVLRVDRPQAAETATVGGERPHMAAGRAILGLDLKSEAGHTQAQRIIANADVLLEGFRPGVMERLGLGPEPCHRDNPGLVYARMTGWGQQGPLAERAGHDVNYIALTGALHSFGRRDTAPVPPANLVGDFGGGGMLVVTGILSALVERQTSGQGQVVDAAMVDGAALLLSMMHEDHNRGSWRDERGTNYLDTGAPWYDVYECSDGGYVSVGAIEPQFYAALLQGLGMAAEELPDQWDEKRWPELRTRIATVIASRSRDEWAEIFAGTDACVQPVLTLAEAAEHPHLARRGTVRQDDGQLWAGPAPRFSRTPGATTRAPDYPEPSAEETLRAWGVNP